MSKTNFTNGDAPSGIHGTRVAAEFLNAVNTHHHTGLDEDGHGALPYAADTGTANAYVVNLSPALTQYITGMPIYFKAVNANTGASTVNVNGLGVKTIKKNGGADLVSGDIQTGQIVCVSYDGTYMQFISPPINATVLWDGTAGRSASPTPGANTIPVAGADGVLPAGWAGLLNVKIFTSGTTYTPTPGTHKIIIELIGGGGGGGGAAASTSTQVSAAGGGGSGGYARKFFTGINGTYSYSIGAGGNGGSAGNNNGTAGGNTTFTGPGAITVTAYGGSYGLGSPAVSQHYTIYSGAGGNLSTNGDINLRGTPGGDSLIIYGSGSNYIVVSGSGGPSILGSYASTLRADSLGGPVGGMAAYNYGGGGGGGKSSYGNVAAGGGAGAQGVIIVWEFS